MFKETIKMKMKMQKSPILPLYLQSDTHASFDKFTSFSDTCPFLKSENYIIKILEPNFIFKTIYMIIKLPYFAVYAAGYYALKIYFKNQGGRGK